MDKPILFSGPMVRALLAGRKTQTRRVLKVPSWTNREPHEFLQDDDGIWKTIATKTGCLVALPIPQIGTSLWVREACATWEGRTTDVVYRADVKDSEWADLRHDMKLGAPWKVRNSIHMPRWASRLTLTVTDVRVQQLHDISHADAVAEGVGIYPHSMSAQKRFMEIWNSINGPDAWDMNPRVAACTFTVRKGNIDNG